MHIAVVFHSGYGHTARQALAVAEGVEQSGFAKALLVDVAKDIPWDELGSSAGMIFGCPTYMGGPSAVFKKFMEDSSSRWMKQEWADKVAAGFTTSSSQSGDKLNTLVSLAIFAAQHGMFWISTGLMPGNNVSTGSVNDINRLGSWLGAMAQANFDQPPELAPPESDLLTAQKLGLRVASAAKRFAGA
ncbi:flavodoxin family protein [Nevskia sp.]|uniref:flavodoxin family protein n=1 Tax=Nevskia sp. TaxID=1929292 RepID=UPI0025E48516|nr:flavodoxin family protein [Nevskia sp.]